MLGTFLQAASGLWKTVVTVRDPIGTDHDQAFGGNHAERQE